MRKLIHFFMKIPVLGRLLFFLYRAKIAFGYLYKVVFKVIKWLIKSNETTNFTYDLEERNMQYLAYLVSETANITINEAIGYMDEILNDKELAQHIASETALSKRSHMADKGEKFGRRLGWYMFVRATKPKVIIETGVDKGLGACVLTSALKRNSGEGFNGKYYGTDINPRAGYLLSGPYKEFGKILYGDSIKSLLSLDESIDVFINDSDHSADYEAEEYRVVTPKLSENAIILGDNSHTNSKLMEYSIANNRRYILFREEPVDHWYQGAGIGISYR